MSALDGHIMNRGVRKILVENAIRKLKEERMEGA
jgi:hypothetical protein